MAVKSLSVVVPAYKQEKTILQDVKNLDKVLSSFPYKYEIVIVVDGFLDNTFEIAKRITNKQVKVFGYKENMGKGFAIKYGFSKATGDIIGFIDAGLDLDPEEISIMLGIMQWNNADIVIGSKLHPDSKVNYPTNRKILSWGYRMIVKTLFRLNVKDTQVGLKFFRKNVAKDVFPRIIVKNFAFDIEVLAVAVKLGYSKIYETPIKLRFRQGSITNSNFWKIAFSMFVETLAVFYRMNIIRYYDKKEK